MLQYSQMPRCGVSLTIRSFRFAMTQVYADARLAQAGSDFKLHHYQQRAYGIEVLTVWGQNTGSPTGPLPPGQIPSSCMPTSRNTSVYRGRMSIRSRRSRDPKSTLQCFWRAKFVCDQQNCGNTVLAHTSVEAGYTAADIAKLLLSSIPGLACADAHFDTER